MRNLHVVIVRRETAVRQPRKQKKEADDSDYAVSFYTAVIASEHLTPLALNSINTRRLED